MNSANIFCTCLLKTWPFGIKNMEGPACPVVESKRSQLQLCEGSVIGRPLIGGEYEWSDVGNSLLKVLCELYFLVQRLKLIY